MEKVKVLRRHMASDAIVVNKAGLNDVFHQALDNHINGLKEFSKKNNMEFDTALELHESLSCCLLEEEVMKILFPEEED